MNNGTSGVGIFTPIPGTAAYNNLVSDNTADNNGLGGIVLHSHAGGQNLNGNSIISNTISNNAPDPAAGVTVPVGIVVFTDTSHGALPITNTTITLNTITHESIDVFVGYAQTNLALHLNNLLGGTGVIGVQNAGTGTVDAAENYWGCAAGPGKSDCTTVSGNVTYTPWLTKKST